MKYKIMNFKYFTFATLDNFSKLKSLTAVAICQHQYLRNFAGDRTFYPAW